MCEFCKKHAGGKGKWYFNPKNYSKEMGEARIGFLENIAGMYFNEKGIGEYEIIERSKNIPLLNKLFTILGTQNLKKTVGGQIIPLNDALKVLELCDNPALLPCACRQMVGMDKYCCLNFGLIPELYKKANPDEYFEEVSVNNAKRLLIEWDKKGLYHLIAWGKAPYVTTICNCTSATCLQYKARYVLELKTAMLKGEYIARVDERRCVGCKTCLKCCPFGAIFYNVDEEKVLIDIRKCVGCGLCMNECPNNAVKLIERRFTPAKNLW